MGYKINHEKELIKKNIMKKIILRNAIDFWIFVPWFFPILPIIVLERLFNVNEVGIEGFIILFFIFFIYFGVIPYLFKGYTVGGFVSGVRIASTTNKTINPIIYFLRQINSFGTIIKGCISGSIYLNKNLQFEHDKAYNTKIVIRNYTNITQSNLEFGFLNIFSMYIKYWMICFLAIGVFLVPNLIKVLV